MDGCVSQPRDQALSKKAQLCRTVPYLTGHMVDACAYPEFSYSFPARACPLHKLENPVKIFTRGCTVSARNVSEGIPASRIAFGWLLTRFRFDVNSSVSHKGFLISF